jgi:hypothetical protein
VIVLMKRGPFAWMPVDERTARAYQWASARGRAVIAVAVWLGFAVDVWLQGVLWATLLRARSVLS